MGLTVRRRVFVEEYLRCWNASEAARRAGYSERSAYAQGCRLLKNAEVLAYRDERLVELKAGTDEVITGLTEIGRGDMSDFVHVSEEGVLGFDLTGAKESGKFRLVKSLAFGKDGEVKLELYCRDAALVQLGKAHGLFRDEVRHTGNITIELDV